MQKICNLCKVLKDFSLYYPDKRTKTDGLQGRCIKYQNKLRSIYNKNNPLPHRARNLKWSRLNRTKRAFLKLKYTRGISKEK